MIIELVARIYIDPGGRDTCVFETSPDFKNRDIALDALNNMHEYSSNNSTVTPEHRQATYNLIGTHYVKMKFKLEKDGTLKPIG